MLREEIEAQLGALGGHSTERLFPAPTADDEDLAPTRYHHPRRYRVGVREDLCSRSGAGTAEKARARDTPFRRTLHVNEEAERPPVLGQSGAASTTC